MIYKKLSPEVFLIEEFLDSEQCKKFIELSETIGYENAPIETEKGKVIVESIRNNYRVLYDNSELAEELWAKARHYIPETIGNSKAMGLNNLFRFYKYLPGQKFRKHRDESYIKNDTEASYYTFMIYLNDDFIGGQTKFSNITVSAAQGSLLIFLHSLEHEGCEVMEGTKYVLRTDVMYSLSAG